MLNIMQHYKFGLTMTTNGRQNYMKRACRSLRTNVLQKWEFDYLAVVDDSGTEGNFQLLRDQLPEFHVIRHPSNMGLAAAVQTVWNKMPDDIDFVFHMEDDFLFNASPDLYNMTKLLLKHPYLWEVILKRQPVNADETEAGGYINQSPSEYLQKQDKDNYWVETQKFFSLNPGLIPKNVFSGVGWPDGNEAEMTEKMVNENGWAAIWGAKNDQPMIHHIGDYRAQNWKL